MDNFLKRRTISKGIIFTLIFLLSACVTQNFEDDTPVVQNQANRYEMAITRVSLGMGYLKMGNMTQAKLNLEKAKNFSPNLVQVYTAFAHYYDTVGEHNLTVASYEKALSIDSNDADTLNNYGVYLCKQGETLASEQQFLKAIAVPSYILVAQSYENLASCFLKNDDFTKAELYLNKAILHSPSDAAILFQMIRLQYAMGEYPRAKKYEQRFEKNTRRFTSQSLALAYKVYLKVGERKKAKNYGTMLVKMYPQSWEANQYILNQLELIDADNLAKRFKSTQVVPESNKPKKRVVKLSPKKRNTPPITVKNSDAPVPVAEPETVIGDYRQTEKLEKIESLEASEPVTSATITSVEGEVKDTVSIDSSTVSNKRTIVLSAPASVNTKTAEMASTGSIVEAMTIESAELKNKKDILIKEKSSADTAQASEIASSLTMLTMANESEQSVEKEAVQEQTKDKKEPTKEKSSVKNIATHLIVKGDTLYGISIKYNIKIKALRKWNNISSRKRLRIGTALYIENPIK